MNGAVLIIGVVALALLARAAHGGLMQLYNPARLTASQRSAADMIITEAQAAGVNPAFMLALAVTESSLSPIAKGDDGISLGLFQLQVRTARDYEPTTTADDLLRMSVNSRIAMQFARALVLKYPFYTAADYAEAWTLGGYGRFVLQRRNPKKVDAMRRAVADLSLSLNLNEVMT